MSKKKKIKNVDVKVLHVPHFEGLTMATMLEYASQHQEVIKYLPDIEREIEKLPRAYIANLVYTVVGDPFKTWVDL